MTRRSCPDRRWPNLTYELVPPSSRSYADGWPETTADWTRSRKTGAGSGLGATLVGVES